MGIVRSIKRVFRKDGPVKEKQLKSMKGLSKEQLEKELGFLIHELCVKYASDFVKEEMKRGGSLFSEVPKSRFFHEMVIINFWALKKIFGEKRKTLLSRIHKDYLEHFNIRDKDWEDTLSERCRGYNITWDDYSGHHDEFGVKAAQNIFGRETDIPFPQTSFWLITYTDDIMQKFLVLKNSFKEEGIKI